MDRELELHVAAASANDHPKICKYCGQKIILRKGNRDWHVLTADGKKVHDCAAARWKSKLGHTKNPSSLTQASGSSPQI